MQIMSSCFIVKHKVPVTRKQSLIATAGGVLFVIITD